MRYTSVNIWYLRPLTGLNGELNGVCARAIDIKIGREARAREWEWEYENENESEIQSTVTYGMG